MAHQHGHREHNQHRSSERRFDRYVTKIDGRPIGCRRLFCATPGCGQQGEILDRTEFGLVPKVIMQRFAAKGWEVGTNDNGKHDFCPACVEKAKAERRARKIKPINGHALEVVPQEPKAMQPQTAVPPSISETPPTEMTRSDRRLIFLQLEECYASESEGYKTPWTDAAVAKHLNLPLAWVMLVREENFGPAADNSEIRDMLHRVKVAAGEAEAVLADAKTIRNEGAALVERINALAKQASDVGKSLAGLTAIAERIERSVKT